MDDTFAPVYGILVALTCFYLGVKPKLVDYFRYPLAIYVLALYLSFLWMVVKSNSLKSVVALIFFNFSILWGILGVYFLFFATKFRVRLNLNVKYTKSLLLVVIGCASLAIINELLALH